MLYYCYQTIILPLKVWHLQGCLLFVCQAVYSFLNVVQVSGAPSGDFRLECSNGGGGGGGGGRLHIQCTPQSIMQIHHSETFTLKIQCHLPPFICQLSPAICHMPTAINKLTKKITTYLKAVVSRGSTIQIPH